MPAEHDLDPPALTDEERLEKKRYESAFVFETKLDRLLQPVQFAPVVRKNANDV